MGAHTAFHSDIKTMALTKQSLPKLDSQEGILLFRIKEFKEILIDKKADPDWINYIAVGSPDISFEDMAGVVIREIYKDCDLSTAANLIKTVSGFLDTQPEKNNIYGTCLANEIILALIKDPRTPEPAEQIELLKSLSTSSLFAKYFPGTFLIANEELAQKTKLIAPYFEETLLLDNCLATRDIHKLKTLLSEDSHTTLSLQFHEFSPAKKGEFAFFVYSKLDHIKNFSSSELINLSALWQQIRVSDYEIESAADLSKITADLANLCYEKRNYQACSFFLSPIRNFFEEHNLDVSLLLPNPAEVAFCFKQALIPYKNSNLRKQFSQNVKNQVKKIYQLLEYDWTNPETLKNRSISCLWRYDLDLINHQLEIASEQCLSPSKSSKWILYISGVSDYNNALSTGTPNKLFTQLKENFGDSIKLVISEAHDEKSLRKAFANTERFGHPPSVIIFDMHNTISYKRGILKYDCQIGEKLMQDIMLSEFMAKTDENSGSVTVIIRSCYGGVDGGLASGAVKALKMHPDYKVISANGIARRSDITVISAGDDISADVVNWRDKKMVWSSKNKTN